MTVALTNVNLKVTNNFDIEPKMAFMKVNRGDLERNVPL